MLDLCTKYRPQYFDEMYGNEHVSSFLRSVVSKPEEAPRYYGLFGPFGASKTTSARCFANEMSKRYPTQYIEIDSGDQQIKDNFDKVRDIIFSEVPGWKVVCIDEAALLPPETSQRLLKILEDFTGRVFIFMCLPEQSLVSTQRGLCSLKDLLPGDSVWTPNGFRSVKRRFESGRKECFRIKTSLGRVDVSGSHPMRVVRENGFEWVRADQLRVGDVVPIYSESIHGTCSLTLEECEFLGRLVGDGYWNCQPKYPDHHHFGILFNDEEIDYGRKLLDSCGLTYKVYERGHVRECVLHKPQGWSKIANKFGLEDYTAHGKTLPTVVPTMDTLQFESFMKGWFDADGVHCCGKNHEIIISMSHRLLLIQLRKELFRRGIPVRVTIGREYKERELKFSDHTSVCKCGAYRVILVKDFRRYSVDWDKDLARSIQASGKVNNFSFKYKALNGNDSYNSMNINSNILNQFTGAESTCLGYVNIRSITNIGYFDTYDIEMDSEEHDFIVSGFDTHNCTTDPQLLPDPLRSRLHEFFVKTMTTQQTVEYLKQICTKESIDLPDSVLQAIALNSQGHYRTALKGLESAIFQGADKFLADYSGIWNAIHDYFFNFDLPDDQVLRNLMPFHPVQLRPFVTTYFTDNIINTNSAYYGKLYPPAIIPKMFMQYLKFLSYVKDSDTYFAFLRVYRSTLRQVYEKTHVTR